MKNQSPAQDCPDPREVKNAEEFVAAMRRLRAWSGLTFRQVERNAADDGVPLPHSTLVTALRRKTLPREELVAAFVRACGCSADTVSLWVTVRRQLAMEQAQAATAAAPPPAASPQSSRTPVPAPTPAPAAVAEAGANVPAAATGRARRVPNGWRLPNAMRFQGARLTSIRWVLLLLAVGTLLAGASAPPVPTAPALRDTAASDPARHTFSGNSRIRSARTNRCLSARRDVDGRIFPMPCAYAFPSRSLQEQPDGSYVIATQHPDLGSGCMGVRRVEVRSGVDDDFCGRKGANTADRFWLVHSTAHPGAFQLRIAHTELCIEAPASAGRPVFLAACASGRLAQAFTIEADPRPGI
ncbi:helix-turn-helix domain-containing protein [Actinomadura logoneensis]|nr:hypothetical protein [Actinomadura logoneensis]